MNNGPRQNKFLRYILITGWITCNISEMCIIYVLLSDNDVRVHTVRTVFVTPVYLDGVRTLKSICYLP